MADEETTDRRGAPAGYRGGTPNEGKMGNLPHERTDEIARLVEEMAALQVTQKEIATVLQISEDTIQRHYADEFARGRTNQGLKLRRHAYNIAYGVPVDIDRPEAGFKQPPDGKMTQFLLERQFGMIQRSEASLVGDVERPLQVIRRTIVDPKAGE